MSMQPEIRRWFPNGSRSARVHRLRAVSLREISRYLPVQPSLFFSEIQPAIRVNRYREGSSVASRGAEWFIIERDRSGIHDDPHGPRPHCFARGTRIRTAEGEVPVESLAIGALVMTTSGALPVKWVGRQAMKKDASASWHPSVVPVRVSRFAIDDQTPHRDLYLSQEHCLFIDGVLIPVKYLVNGRSIAFDDNAKMSETIEYFGVLLDTHEVIFAEGTAAETFQHWGGQIAWDNLSDYQDLYGTEPAVMSAFAPICRYTGGRAEVRGLLRLATSRFVDVRDPIQTAHDRVAARATAIAA